jgi:ubiquinone/menaquinone biosynthesis C-methylase UbiE
MSISLRVARQRAAAAALAARVAAWLGPATADSRALDAGCGTGALAEALAPLVGEVVGVDLDESLLAEARRLPLSNVSFAVADARALPFGAGSFDIAGCHRVLHHVRRPELVLAELVRVTRPGGKVLVVDQLGAVDPLVSLELDRFERTRDPSHARLLPDGDIRALLEANDLTVARNEIVREPRQLEPYLDITGCEGDARDRARALAPGAEYTVEIGWYLAVRTPL